LRKKDLDKLIAGKFGDINSNPELLLIDLQNSFGNDLFKETLICNLKHFPTLLKEIKKQVSFIGRNIKKLEIY